MKYEYDADMESTYLAALLKSFAKQLEARHFDILVVDACNAKLAELAKFVSAAKDHSYAPFVLETKVSDPELCYQRNVHKHSLAFIQKVSQIEIQKVSQN